MGKPTYFRILLTCLAGLVFGGPTFGCTLSAWLGGVDPDGDQVAGGPGQAVEIPRFSGDCAMQVSDGFIQDFSPASETSYSTRFYVLPRGSGSANIVTGFSNEPAPDGSTVEQPVYTVSYDNGTITVTDNVSGDDTGALPVNSGHWNGVEIKWTANDTLSVWINADARFAAPTATASTGPGTLEALRFGSDNPSGTVLFGFDAIESKRTTSIGIDMLVVGDADGDGAVTEADAALVEDEIQGLAVAVGQPDCTLDGSVDFRDVECIGAKGGFATTEGVPAASDAAAGDRFGHAVANHGNLYAVGRPGAGGGTGQVIVYRAEGGALVEDGFISPPGGRTATSFGASLALSGNRLLVGAPADVGGDGSALRAALFVRSAEGWAFRTEFGSVANDDAFGAAVSLAGPLVAIGAPRDDQAGVDAGAVHVFLLDENDNVAQTRKLTPAVGTAEAYFGKSLALSGDRLAVGAPGTAASAGALHVFDGLGETLTGIVDRGTVIGAAAGDGLGTAVALDHQLLLAGAPGEDGNGFARGAAYLFDAPSLEQLTRLVSDAPVNGGAFGRSVALAGGHIAIGAPGEGFGAVIRFGPDFSVTARFDARSGQLSLGTAVSLSEDALLIGAPESNSGAGAARVVRDHDQIFAGRFE